MPYRRRRYRRRFRRRYNARRAIARLYRRVKPELKKMTWNINGDFIGPLGALNSSPYRYDLTSQIAQGLQNNERVGRHIKVSGIVAKLFVTGPQSGNVPGSFRCYFHRDNDITPISGILPYDNSPPVDWDDMNFEERRWMIKDRMVSLGRVDAGSYNRVVKISHKFKKGGMNVMYVDGSGKQDTLKNQICFSMLANTDSPTPDNNVRVSGTIRIYYTDV